MRLVERPLRLSPRLLALPPRPRALRSLAIGMVAMLLPVGAGLASNAGSAYQLRAALAGAGTATAAAGPVSATSPFGTTTAASGPVAPAPATARVDYPQYPPECNLAPAYVNSPPCTLGGHPGSGHVVLLGDSHAGQWFPAVRSLASQRGWATEVLVKGGCPLPVITFVSPWLARPFTECDTWRTNTLRRIAAEPRPALVFMSVLDRYTTDEATILDGWQPVLDALRALHVPIVYLRDNPYPGTDIPSCVSGALADWSKCRFDRADALWPDPLASGITDGSITGVTLLDLTSVLCPPGPPDCPAVIGGTLLYRDFSHLTNTAAAAMAPTLEHALMARGLLH
jgi:hypothetical protein